jgi:hypothetical protein
MLKFWKGIQIKSGLVVTVRSRQHVVTTRLNDDEYAMYKRVLMRALLKDSELSVKNRSEAFRVVLHRVYLDST